MIITGHYKQIYMINFKFQVQWKLSQGRRLKVTQQKLNNTRIVRIFGQTSQFTQLTTNRRIEEKHINHFGGQVNINTNNSMRLSENKGYRPTSL